MNYKFEELNIKNNEHFRAIKTVEKWSHQWETMQSYGFTALTRHPFALLGFAEVKNKFQDGFVFGGHAAITEVHEINEKNYAKIGALAVGEAYRGNGLASAMIGELISSSSEAMPEIDKFYAYVHEDSIGAFVENGAEIIGARSGVPPPTGCNIIVGIDPID